MSVGALLGHATGRLWRFYRQTFRSAWWIMPALLLAALLITVFVRPALERRTLRVQASEAMARGEYREVLRLVPAIQRFDGPGAQALREAALSGLTQAEGRPLLEKAERAFGDGHYEEAIRLASELYLLGILRNEAAELRERAKARNRLEMAIRNSPAVLTKARGALREGKIDSAMSLALQIPAEAAEYREAQRIFQEATRRDEAEKREGQARDVATTRSPWLETGAIIDSGVTMAQLKAVRDLVRAWGFRCDSVSGARAWIWSPGYTLHCNHYRYEYSIEDKGGIWTVKVE